ncbi:PIF1 DNA helicase/replication A1-like protein [Artemisia annua]|uniref:PIF1 DNA helicase/replication A1-like protein n=1 Tax=Artemisia annua TaxID=35608 RepID=A0A2U1L4A8_ARTAN|nr:PIF1 DNA helicase/replication A1-like protein [Artemisia annua]
MNYYAHIQSDLRLSDDEKKNVALFWIEELMRSRGRSLRQLPEMPFPDDRYISQFGNRLIYDETHYNPEELECEYARLFVLDRRAYAIKRKIVETVPGNAFPR